MDETVETGDGRHSRGGGRRSIHDDTFPHRCLLGHIIDHSMLMVMMMGLAHKYHDDALWQAGMRK